MDIYKTKKAKYAGTSFSEIRKNAEYDYKNIILYTERSPYIRSKYFHREKIFLSLFWRHLFDKNEKERIIRLRFFNCAIDLLRNTTYNPVTRENYKQKNELLHRFTGVVGRDHFVVQVKENKRSKRKDLISIYPIN